MTLPDAELIVRDPGMGLWEQILRRAETECNGRGWDQPTEIYNLYQETLGVGLARTHLPGRLGHLYPPDLLDALTERLPQRPAERRQRDQTIVGVILVIEGWGVRGDNRDQARMAGARADAAARRLHLRLDRIECRQADLATLGGQHLTLTRVRGEEPQIAAKSTGLVPEALLRFVAVLAAA